MRVPLIAVLSLLAVTPIVAQWTEPDSTSCPQYGPAVRAVWINNDNLRLYLTASLDAILVTARDSVNGEWGPLVALPPQINATGTQTSMCESPFGDTLYFTCNSDEHPVGGYGWIDIYYSVMTDTGWGPAVNLGPNINGPGEEWSVSLSRDGGTMFLSSQGDLYYALKQPDGTWGPRIDIGFNTGYTEEHPSLSPDGSRLFFYRSDLNAGNIYVSNWVDGSWSLPESLPPPVNDHFTTEMNPCMANDARTLWYRREQHYAEYDFQIVTSIDTSVLGLDLPRPLPRQISEPLLRAFSQDSGWIGLQVEGTRIIGPRTVVISNILGQVILKQWTEFSPSGEHFAANLDVGVLPAGTYVVSVELDHKTLHSKLNILH